jgi:glycine/D-amino acid oxidase-like deaminating enzyme
MTFDVAVIGAGIVGVACASALSTAELSVVVIDPNGIATGTTAAGMGHIVVMDDSEAQFALTHYSQKLWNALADEMPQAAEFEHRGTIWVAVDEDEMNEVRRKRKFYGDRGVDTHVLDEFDLRAAEPNLRDGLAGGLLVESDSVVYQLTASRFLLERARTNGCVTHFGDRVTEIKTNSVKFANGAAISAEYVVNCAGIHAPELSPEIKIVERKGHLMITDRYPNFANHQLVELGYLRSAHGSDADSVAFNLQPRATGQMLVGSSRQFGVRDLDVDHQMLRRMSSRAIEYMPKLKELSAIRIWTGFRPSTPDNLPYIGRLESQKNAFIAAGHEGLGITTALGTAELITNMIIGIPSAIPVEPYSPSRNFGVH